MKERAQWRLLRLRWYLSRYVISYLSLSLSLSLSLFLAIAKKVMQVCHDRYNAACRCRYNRAASLHITAAGWLVAYPVSLVCKKLAPSLLRVVK
jgi:hypothetical protein